MKIEAIDPIRATDDDGRDVIMEPGDRKSVGPNFGKLACQMGWASDVDGQVATGEKRRDSVAVTPNNLIVEPEVS